MKVGRGAEKKFLPGFKMPKQAAPVMQGANCTLANIIGTTLCNTIYNLHLNFEVVLNNCSFYALFFIVSILTSNKQQIILQSFIIFNPKSFCGYFCPSYKTWAIYLSFSVQLLSDNYNYKVRLCTLYVTLNP